MKRAEAVSILKQFLDDCAGIDSHSQELLPPEPSLLTTDGYKIIIMDCLDETNKFH